MRFPAAVAWMIAGGFAAAAPAPSAIAPPIPVRHVEGLVHGFLALRTTSGTSVATGDLTQTASGEQVTTRVVFHYKDGSLHDETAVFTQRGVFRLLSDHLVQKGPAFPTTLDMTIDRARGEVTTRYQERGGSPKTDVQRMAIPDDLANGMIPTVLKNVRSQDGPVVLSYIAATPRPRLVKLDIGPGGLEPFSTAGQPRQAMHFVVKIEIGGVSGWLAPLVGKQPPDSHVWILQGSVPAFVKSEAPMYMGGPALRIELVSPDFKDSQAGLPETVSIGRKP